MNMQSLLDQYFAFKGLAESASYYCGKGSRDAVYNVQLLPELDRAGKLGWSVYAQHGKKGANLRKLVKLDNGSWSNAVKCYLDTKADRVAHAYASVPLVGDSVLDSKKLAAQHAAYAALPPWTGFCDFFGKAQSKFPLLYNGGAIVGLADISFGLAGGVHEAIGVIARLPGKDEVFEMLSREVIAGLDLARLEDSCDVLQQRCKELM